MTIFALGPPGTYGHEAAIIAQRRLPTILKKDIDSQIEFGETNLSTIHSSEKEEGFAVVPIENSIGGPVFETMRDFWVSTLLNQSNDKLRVNVMGEIHLPIGHCLFAHPSIRYVGEIQKVISHPQALSQCRKNLDKLNIRNRAPVSSTALAAKLVSEHQTPATTAALCSDFAGETYGLRKLADHMEDVSGNITRFHLLGPYTICPQEKNRTAVVFTLPNQPGALFEMLRCFKQYEINLSSVHSMPTGRPGQYAFYLEFDCHLDELNGRHIKEHLTAASEQVLFLGSFPQSE